MGKSLEGFEQDSHTYYLTSVQFSRSVVFNSLQPRGLQHVRLPCPSPTPAACSNSCPLSRWCHPTISSSVVPFSSCLKSFPASGSFPRSHFFASGGQSIGISALASVLSVNIQDWFPLGHHQFGLRSNNREGTQPRPSTENWTKDWLSMAPPIRIRPSFPYSQSHPTESFHKPLILICQRADRMKTTITEN